MTRDRKRYAVHAAFAGFALAILLGILQSAIFNGENVPSWILSLTWLHDLAAALNTKIDPVLGGGPYKTMGRFTLLPYVCAMAAVSALAWEPDRLGRWFRRIGVASLALAMMADFVTYWVAGLEYENLRLWSFWRAEVPLLLICLLALTLAAVAQVLNGKRASLSLLPLGLVLPASMGFTALLQYVPHGPLAGLCVITAVSLSRSSGKAR